MAMVQMMRLRAALRFGASAGALAVLLSSPGALAQTTAAAESEDSAGLEEIVVTAQKREQSLQDVPISITVFSDEAIEAGRIQGLADYVDLTPNVAVQTQGNRGRNSVTIRGVSRLGGAVNSFGIYVDEFNVAGVGSVRTFDPQLFDIERLEVLRGPQGDLFGRNVTAGAINITTKKPSSEFGGELAADISSFDTYLLRGAINIPIAGDKAAIRAVGLFEDSGGFIENIGPAGIGDESDTLGGRIALRLTPNDRLTIDTAVSLVDYDGGFNSLIPIGFDYTSGSPAALDPGTGYYPENRDKLNTNDPYFSSNRQLIATNRIEYDFGGVSLISVTGLMDVKYNEFGDFDYTTVDGFRAGNGTNLDTFSQELRLQSSDAGNFSWVVGGLYSRDKTVNFLDFEVGTADIFGFPEGPIFDDEDSETFRNLSVFGSGTVTVLDGSLDLTLGMRYSRDRVSQEIDNVDFGTPFQASGKTSFDGFMPRFALTYRLSDDTSVYGVVSKGYKAGGLQLSSGAPRYNEETLWNYEAGFKTELFNNRLRLNTAVFQIDWDDIQVFSYDLSTGGLSTFVQNAAKARARGFEMDLAARPAEGLDLTAGVGYVDAKYRSFPNADVGGVITDLSGTRLPLSPKWSLSSTGQITRPVSDTLDWFARAEWSYRSNQFDNDAQTFIPSRATWNFRLGIESERYSLVGYVENAFDNKEWTGLRCLFLFYAGCVVDPDPRRWGVRGTVKF